MDTATGVIPESLFQARFKPSVIFLLLDMKIPGKTKARILKDWAKWTGVKLAAADLGLVEGSGFEAAPVIKVPE